MANFQNLVFDQGDDVDVTITFVTDDFEEAPIDASLFSEIRFNLRHARGEVPFAIFALGSGVTRSAGLARLEIARAFTSGLSPETPYPYDVEIVTSAGKTVTTQKGYVQIGAD